MKWVYVVNYTKKSHGAAKKSTLSRRLVGVLQRAGAVEDERRVADEVAGPLELETLTGLRSGQRRFDVSAYGLERIGVQIFKEVPRRGAQAAAGPSK